LVTSRAFFTCAEAKAKASALQLVAVDVAWIAEQVGGAPEERDAGSLLFFLEHLHHGVEILVRLGQRAALRRDVAVVEAIERRAELFEKLEPDADAIDGVLDRVGAAFPGPQHGSRPERIAARSAHRMPIGYAEAEVVFHRLAFDQFAFVVMAKRQRVLRLGAFVTDFGNIGKGWHGSE
jgi:hypothetical protein